MLIEHIGEYLDKGSRIDSANQGLRIPNYDLEIGHWNINDEHFREFVIKTLVEIDEPTIFLSPVDFKIIFNAISHGLQKDLQAKGVADRTIQILKRESGSRLSFDAAMELVSAVINGTNRINGRGPTPSQCALAWRIHVYRLARAPAFMRTDEGMDFLCVWFAAENENLEISKEALKREIDYLERQGFPH